MKHTLTISNLTDEEAAHIADVLNEYKVKILTAKVEAICCKETGRAEWCDGHLAWHETIMKKIIWTKG